MARSLKTGHPACRQRKDASAEVPQKAHQIQKAPGLRHVRQLPRKRSRAASAVPPKRLLRRRHLLRWLQVCPSFTFVRSLRRKEPAAFLRSQLPSLPHRKHRRDGGIRLHREDEMANPLAWNEAGVLLERAPDSQDEAATPSPLQRVRRTQLHRSAAESQSWTKKVLLASRLCKECLEHAEAMAEAVRVCWSLKIEAALDDGEFEDIPFEVSLMPRRRQQHCACAHVAFDIFLNACQA